MAAMALPIEDYAIIGDLHTAALVGPGRLDRLALPARTSTRAPASPGCSATRTTASGGSPRPGPRATVTATAPALPGRDPGPRDRVRHGGGHRPGHRLHAHPRGPPPGGPAGRGDQRARSRCAWSCASASTTARPSRGSPSTTACSRRPPGPTRWRCGPGPRPTGEDMRTVAEFTVDEGQQLPFVLDLVPLARAAAPAGRPVVRRSATTEAWWQTWSSACTYEGDYARRRAALAHHPEGPHLRAHRRHRGRRHHLAARGARAATATGTTATAGCATPPSPSSR